MTTITDIKKIETSTLQKILEACEKSFPKELSLEEFYGEGQTTWSIPEIGIVYKNTTSKNDLLKFVETLTETENIRHAYAKIYEEVEKRGIENKKEKTKEARRPEEQDKTTINKDESKQLQEEQVARETKRKELISKSNKDVEDALKRKEQIASRNKKDQEQNLKKTDRQKVLDETEVENKQRGLDIKEQQELLKRKIEESKKIASDLKDSNNQDKKIYAKVEIKNQPKFTEEEKKAFEVYKNEIISNPKESLIDLSKTIEERITPELTKQGLKIEEIKLVSNQTATKIVENVIQIDKSSYVSPITQIAILEKVSKDTKVLPKILLKKETLNIFQNSANDIAATTIVSDQVTRNISKMAFGETFTSVVFGVDPNQIEITLSETPEPGYTNSINLNGLNQEYNQSLENQNSTLETVKDLGISETKGFLYEKAGVYLEGKIAKLAPESVAGKILQSTEAKSIFFSTFGVGTPVTWEATNWFGGMVIKFTPDSAPILSGISKLTGINFGLAPTAQAVTKVIPIIGTISTEATPVIGTVATGIVTKTGTQLASQAVVQTTTKVAGGLLPTIFASLSTLAGWATFGISIVVGWILGKIIEKINWKKVKESLLPVLLIGGGVLIGGPVGLVLIVGGGVVAIGALSGAAVGIGSVATGIGSFLVGVGSAIGGIVVTIATPIIITLLIIPPTIAFFMFIINSGAYMVPPSDLTFNNIVDPYIEVTKTPVPPGPFENSALTLTIEYKITIRAKKGALENIHLNYECGVVKAGPKINCPPTNPGVPTSLENIQPGETYSFSYKQEYAKGKFEDSLVVDTITVTADTSGKSGIKSSASAGVKIGNPPDDCPSIWPVDSGKITQTPDGSYSHRGVEAIDVSLLTGTKVKATHSGIATLYENSGGYGNHIMITSNCGGKIITTIYAHLLGFSIPNGKEVLLGQMIGSSGDTGNSTGPHLHYEFRGDLQMIPPFIPKTIIRGCSNDSIGCGYIP